MAGEAFPCLVFFLDYTDWTGELFFPLGEMIRNVSPQAQQELAKAVCESSSICDRIILCHTPALLEPVDNCSLGTFDQLDECVESNMNVFLILPRPGLIQSAVKKHSGKVMSIHAVFQVNSMSGPIEACVDLLQKAKHWYPDICRVQKSVNLKKGLLGNFAATAYIVEISMQPSDKFLIQWKFDRKYQDELLIPKIALAEQDIQYIIDEQGRKFLLKSTTKNGCVDFDNSKDGQWVSFPYCGTQQQKELHQLVSVFREKVRDYPSISLQWKKAVRWNNDFKDILTFGILFLGHLSSSDKARVANFLTGCNIDFFFCRANVIVMTLNGLDDNTLLRLAQYAEVPIPACPIQGGFQLSFRPSVSGTASWTTVSVGRIGRYDHVPALEPSEFEAGVGDLKWIVSLLEQQVQATCFQKVFCTLENQDSVACLQFLIPQAIEKQLPLHWDVGGRQICVDHPAAFAVPLSISRRPPEDKFDHWKETANRSFSYRKGRQNSLSHCPKLVDSICRFNLLRHGDILSNGKRFAAMFETDFLPFLFVDGKPNIEDLLEFCGDVFSDNATVGTGFATLSADDHSCQAADIQSEAPVLYVLDVLQDKQDPLKIGRFLLTRKQFFASTSETLLCHAFSACTVALVAPKGSTVDQICGPRDSYDVLKRFPLQCVPAQKRIVTSVDPPKNSNVGIAPKPRDDGAGQQRARSYANGRAPESKVQPPAIVVSPTGPWTQNDNGPGSQMPEPAKSATPKSDEDVPMDEVEDPDQLKGIGGDKSNHETKHEELGKVVRIF